MCAISPAESRAQSFLSGRLPSRPFKCAASLLLGSLALAGCSGAKFAAPSAADPAALPQISGKVHGGQQPISGATIQLYAASTTALKGASTPLLTTAVITDADGGFNITGDYICPTSGGLVYLVATGGNPGLPGSVDNSSIALMSALGTCGNLTQSTFISVNELTTVASVASLAPFMDDASHIGSDPSNITGLSGAFDGASALVDFSTGLPRSSTSGVATPIAQLDTLADILAACINTAGGTAGDGSNCGKLLQYTANGTTTDTILAMIHIVQLPAQNVALLFALVNAQSPFQPALTSAPSDWSIPVGYNLPELTGADGCYLMAIDAAQHIWVYTSAEKVDPNTFDVTPTGNITIYDNSGVALHTIAAGTGGIGFIGQLAADPFGNMWAVNGDLTLSKFDANGAPLSPSAGIPVPYLPPGEFGGGTTEYPLGISYMSFDPSGNLWGIGSGTSSNCYIEANNSGTVLTNTGDFCSKSVNQYTIATATDGSGNAWFLGTEALGKTNSSGDFLKFGTNTNGCFAFNYTGASANALTIQDWTLNMTYDRVHHQLWGISDLGIGAIRDDGSQVFCDAHGANLPTSPYNESIVTGATSSIIAFSYNFIGSAAVDGAGNLWFTNGGVNFLETVNNDGTNPSLTYSYSGGLNELDPTGKLLTPINAKGVSGYQATFEAVGESIAIDAYGNIWLINNNGQLIKVPGLAVPKDHQ